MIVLPIVQRELLIASRDRGTYLTRLVAASAAVFFLIIASLIYSFEGNVRSSVGRTSFEYLTYLAGLMCLFSGSRVSADTISSENRQGTLGLLFLTRLSGWDVVLGKLASCSLPSFLSLISIFPVLAVTQLMGGVGFGEVVLVCVSLTLVLVFSLSAGIMCSTISREARTNSGNTVGLIILVVLVPWGASALLGVFPSIQGVPVPAWVRTWVPNLNPWHVITIARGSSYGSQDYLRASLTLIAETALMLAVASWRARRVWQEKPSRFVRLGLAWRQFKKWFVEGGSAKRLHWRRAALGINPWLWYAGRNRVRKVLLWSMLVVLYMPVLLVALFGSPQNLEIPSIILVVATIVHFLIKGMVASDASYHIYSDVHSGAVEWVLATPLSATELMRGQLLQIRRLYLPAISFAIAVDFVSMAIHIARWGAPNSGDASAMGMLLIGIMFLPLDAWAIGWLGMWTALTARDIRRAQGSAFAAIAIWPGVAAYFISLMVVFAGPRARGPDSLASILMVLFYVGMGLFASIGFARKARSRLEREFRAWARQGASGTAHRKRFRLMTGLFTLPQLTEK
jgi:hypothetical protein